MDEPVKRKSQSIILGSVPDVTSTNLAEGAAANHLEPIEIFLEQPDGSQVSISFLESGDIAGISQILPQTFEIAPNVEEPSSLAAIKGSELLATFANADEAQQISAIQTPDGQIYYFESNPLSKTGKDSQAEAPIFFTLLPKDLYAASSSTPDALKQLEETPQPNESTSTKDNVYTTAREKLKPFVTVHKTKRRSESSVTLIGGDLHLEDKIAAMAALLPVRSEKRRDNKLVCTEQQDNACEEGLVSAYKCDMCDASYGRALQYYGHLKAHAEERALRCVHCPDDKVFAAHSQLLHHERTFHVSVRAHRCQLCDASFERRSQLTNHRRRIHLQERPNACGVCGKAFFKRSDLRSHLNIHLGLDAHVCPTCGRRFNHVSNLNRHLRTHTGVRPFPCTTCGRRFGQASALELHAETHVRTATPLPCPVVACAAKLRNRTALRTHMRQKHPDEAAAQKGNTDGRPAPRHRNFYCRVCGQAFPFAVLLKSHEASHASQAAFNCTWCHQDLPTMELLKSHPCRSPGQVDRDTERAVLTAQMERLLGDSEADDAAGGQDIVIYITHDGQEQQVHIKSAVSRNVPLTSQTVAETVIADLQSSTTLEVAADRGKELGGQNEDVESKREGLCNEEPPPEESLFDGSQTGESDPSALGANLETETLPFIKHLPRSESPPLCQTPSLDTPSFSDTSSPPKADSLSETPPLCKSLPTKTSKPSKSSGKKFRCNAPGCGKVFLKNGNFKQHLGMHFSEARRHLCPVCGESFAWRSTLGKHLLRHEPEEQRQRFACPVCAKTYLFPAQVQDHMRRDHDKHRPHACDVCKKTFFKKHDLKVHLRTHTKETPYMCSTCGRRFSHVSHATRHETTHTGVKAHTCTVCGHRFTQSSALRTHLARHGTSQPAKDRATSSEPVENDVPTSCQPGQSDGPTSCLVVKREGEDVELATFVLAEDTKEIVFVGE